MANAKELIDRMAADAGALRGLLFQNTEALKGVDAIILWINHLMKSTAEASRPENNTMPLAAACWHPNICQSCLNYNLCRQQNFAQCHGYISASNQPGAAARQAPQAVNIVKPNLNDADTAQPPAARRDVAAKIPPKTPVKPNQAAKAQSSVLSKITDYPDKTLAKDLLNAVNGLAKERDAIRWMQKITKSNFEIVGLASSNGDVWMESGSMQGDCLCGVRSGDDVYVIPSPEDTSLRAPDISKWFNIKGVGSTYRMEGVAVGRKIPSGGYMPVLKGAITKED